jgi:GNAT superfamily N-acetyltransferase
VSVLDNPAWSALTTHQAHLSLGKIARRYPAHLAPIGAVNRPDPAALEELADLTAVGDEISLPSTLDGLAPFVPARLRITLQKLLVQMVWARHVDAPGPQIDIAALSEADMPEMLALTALTHPGPFRPQTYTLGMYLGVRERGRLVAMAGQRMHLPGFREISAVCTHPDFVGRGYARVLVTRLVDAILGEGLTPFLHVEDTNERAQSVYRGLGFSERRRLPLLVAERVE